MSATASSTARQREAAREPVRGARRREGFLLASYALLVAIGLWTVVAAELQDDAADVPAASVTPVTKAAPPSGN